MSYEQYRPTGFRMLPPVVKNILIISGLLFLATFGLGKAFNINLMEILGMHYFAASEFSPYQLVTYMFMHGSFSHILFNMLAFWMFGYVLENVWGSKRFLIFFLVTGLGAAMIQMLVFYFQTAPVLEAIDAYKQAPSALAFKSFIESGDFQVVSSGIQDHFQSFQGKYNGMLMQADTLADQARMNLESIGGLKSQLALYPEAADSLNHQIDLLNSQAQQMQHQSDSISRQSLVATMDFMNTYREDFLNAPLVVGASGAVFGILLAFGMMFPNTRIYLYFFIPIKAKWFVIIYGGIELFFGVTDLPGDNVAHFAHLGGMLFGLGLILYWRYRSRRRFNP